MLVGIFIILILIFLIYSYIPSNMYKHRFFKREKDEKKVIYLTFDDGPSSYTEKLLDLLKEYNVKATFFCVADFAKMFPKTIKRFKGEGHVIALHSLNHKNAMLQGPIATRKDLDESIKIMKELGIEIKYYRPPWGDTNLYLLHKLKQEKLDLILWDVMAEDWKANATENIIAEKLFSRIKEGSIICLHDGRGKKEAPERMIKALRQAIPVLLEKGYEFRTINEYENEKRNYKC